MKKTRPTRVLVGEMGRPHRTADDALVVAAAFPGDLTSHGVAGAPADGWSGVMIVLVRLGTPAGGGPGL